MMPLVKEVHHFQEANFRSAHRLFELADSTRKPAVLIITCSELQFPPHRLIPSNLDRVYVLQKFANIVAPWTGSKPLASGSIEAALGLYSPTDIIVCGHSPCGILEKLGDPCIEELPYSSSMLQHAK